MAERKSVAKRPTKSNAKSQKGKQAKAKQASVPSIKFVKQGPIHEARAIVDSNKDNYIEFFKQLMIKKEDINRDCRYGRTRFMHSLSNLFKSIGLNVEQVEMPGKPLQVYGPEGCPNAILAYTPDQDYTKWTLCICGHYDQNEPYIHDPSLLLDGRYCNARYQPENWGVLICWLLTLKTLNSLNNWPVNIKIIWTANQTDDAPTLVKFIDSLKKSFFADVDFFCSATTLSRTDLPGGVIYSGRGCCHFILEVSDFTDKIQHCSCLSGPFKEVAPDMVFMLNDLENSCVYKNLSFYEEIKMPHHFEKVLKKAYVRDLDPVMGYWNKDNVLKRKEENLLTMWKPEIRLEGLDFPKKDDLKSPNILIARFFIKHMTEAAPNRIEEMVNQLLAKKWYSLSSDLQCKLSMNYWSRAWAIDSTNRLIKPAKKAARKAFHKPPVEALGLEVNALMPIIQKLIRKEMIVLSLASMLNLTKPCLRKNFIKNLKMLIAFLYNLKDAKTSKAHVIMNRKRNTDLKDIKKELEILNSNKVIF